MRLSKTGVERKHAKPYDNTENAGWLFYSSLIQMIIITENICYAFSWNPNLLHSLLFKGVSVRQVKENILEQRLNKVALCSLNSPNCENPSDLFTQVGPTD